MMTYLSEVIQTWFEIDINQKDQDILQDWLSDWNLFVDNVVATTRPTSNRSTNDKSHRRDI